MKRKAKERQSRLTSSHLKAVEHGIPLAISQRWILCSQFIFTFLVITVALYFVVTGNSNQAKHIAHSVDSLSILAVVALPAFVIFSLSDAVMVDGHLRLKNIFNKPCYINPTRIKHLWHPFGPKTNILIVVYRSRLLLPHISIIMVSYWLRHAENIKRLLEHTQGPECILRKPEAAEHSIRTSRPTD